MRLTHTPLLLLSAALVLHASTARAQLLYKEKARALDSGCYKADFVSEKKTDYVVVYVSGQDAIITPSADGNKHFKSEARATVKGNKIVGAGPEKLTFAGTLVDENTAELILSVPGGQAKSFVLSKVGPVPEEARRVEGSRQNILKLADAVREYKASQGGGPPPQEGATAFEEMRAKGALKDAGILVCPGSATKPPADGEAIGEANSDYVYSPPEPGSTDAVPIIWDRPDNFKNGANVLFSDGRVMWFDKEKFNNTVRTRR